MNNIIIVYESVKQALALWLELFFHLCGIEVGLYALNKPKKQKKKECKYLYLGTERWINFIEGIDNTKDVFVMKLKDCGELDHNTLCIDSLKKYSNYNLEILYSLIDVLYDSDIVLKEIAREYNWTDLLAAHIYHQCIYKDPQLLEQAYEIYKLALYKVMKNDIIKNDKFHSWYIELFIKWRMNDVNQKLKQPCDYKLSQQAEKLFAEYGEYSAVGNLCADIIGGEYYSTSFMSLYCDFNAANDYQLVYELGKYFWKTREYEKAENCYIASYRKNQYFFRPLYKLAKLCEKREEIGQAFDLYDRIIEMLEYRKDRGRLTPLEAEYLYKSYLSKGLIWSRILKNPKLVEKYNERMNEVMWFAQKNNRFFDDLEKFITIKDQSKLKDLMKGRLSNIIDCQK
ncbi:tetratricopeptide repeat protein [Lachnoclostridium sp. An76]|uniref:tetratricopeptide repeat protein n=1 Tax=Lachnoclostridium sp. An76 TaxID=1965654 RepID=UPI000B3A46C7|nr:tetratricopeptide repeat protein [Lachnoclostridium sp. An76]OUN36314.1 hypothetical protein B5G27_04045 [Lachnoclostridium sp. An76]